MRSTLRPRPEIEKSGDIFPRYSVTSSEAVWPPTAIGFDFRTDPRPAPASHQGSERARARQYAALAQSAAASIESAPRLRAARTHRPGIVWSRHLTGWIELESVELDYPYFTDVFEGCQALGGLQPPPIIIRVDEAVEVCFELPRRICPMVRPSIAG